MELRKVFAKNLKQLRTAAGLSQEELAFRADIDRTYVSALERGIYNASVITIERLADALGVEPAEFLLRPAKSTGRKDRSA
jgi:transcriptional regulator with XRE-family HTH domain